MSASITLACLDMAGTTVDDGTAVFDSFRAAINGIGLRGREHDAALDFALDTMGQSKIEVFTTMLEGDAALARVANELFEAHYEHVVRRGALKPVAGVDALFGELRGGGTQVCLTTGFSVSTRDAIIDALGWRDEIDLALSPADAGRGRPWPDMILTAVVRTRTDGVHNVAVAGDTANDLWSGHRAGAAIVAGVRTGAHDDARLTEAPHTHLLDSVADLPHCWRARR